MRSPHLADSRPPYTGQPRPTTIASGARPASRSRQQSAPRDRLPGRHLEALAAKIPSDTERQRDPAVSRVKVGDVHRARGDLVGALEAFGKSLEIAEALAAKDPANTDSQRGLIVALVKVAQLAAQEGRNTEARARYGQALRIARALEATGRLAPADAWMPGDLERQLAALPP